MKIQTINSIEVSSICDLSCRYCCAKDQGKYRETGLMTMDTFLQTMEWVLFFSRRGTQMELNLFGVGEPTLNPLLPDMISQARKNLRSCMPVHINTNGHWVDASTMLVTEAERNYILRLKGAGISHIDVTGHVPFRTAKAIRVLQLCGMPGRLSVDPMTAPNNWAKQVDWFNPTYNAGPCPWINKGQIMVMSNGDITRCCIDAFGKGILGRIDQTDIDAIDVSPFRLCQDCHHTTS